MRVSKKIILTILSLSLLVFSVSCSNEKTTGGGGGVPPAEPEAPGGEGEGGEESPDTSFTAVEESGNQKDITVESKDGSSVNKTTGTIGFTVTGASDYTVMIKKVDKGSSPVDFDVSDFEYNKTSKELKLSPAGLTKFETSKDQFQDDGTKYGYTITFEVADSSDSSRKQDVSVQINLIKAKADSTRRKW